MKKNLLIFFLVSAVAAGFLLYSQRRSSPSPEGEAASSAAPFSAAPRTVKISHKDSYAVVDIEYPELSLSGVSDAVVKKINDSILAGTIGREKEFFTEVQAAQSELSNLPVEVPRDSEFYRRYQVFSSPKLGIVSVLYSDEQSFPGDAHPMNSFSSDMYDAATGKHIAPESIASGNAADLYQKFVEALAAKYDLSADTANLSSAPAGLPAFSSFVVEDAGLHMYVNQDAILSHADGPADVLIPWDSLGGVISARFRK